MRDRRSIETPRTSNAIRPWLIPCETPRTSNAIRPRFVRWGHRPRKCGIRANAIRPRFVRVGIIDGKRRVRQTHSSTVRPRGYHRWETPRTPNAFVHGSSAWESFPGSAGGLRPAPDGDLSPPHTQTRRGRLIRAPDPKCDRRSSATGNDIHGISNDRLIVGRT